jgi:MFS family permease
VLFAALYFSEGAPVGFVWWALPAALREAGVAVDRIGALVGALVLPWAFKFLWAPLVDVARSPRWTLRSWIVGSQALMVATLAPLLWLAPETSFAVIGLCLFAHAVAAATQDVAIDALAIATTSAGERGAVNGWMQVGMLAGRSLFGGGALLVIDRFGLRFVVAALMMTVTAMLAVAAAFAVPESMRGTADDLRASARAFAERLRAAFGTRRTWLALAFAATGGAGFEAVGALAGPFLVDSGQSTATVGWFFAVPAVAAMVVGALAGGHLSDRIGRRPAVAGCAVVVAAAVAGVAAVAAADLAGSAASLAVLGVLYAGIGLFTASSYALFMDLTDPRLGSTQFSAFMGATNLCEAWAAALVGGLVVGVGYPLAFATMAVAGLLALPLLAGMRP